MINEPVQGQQTAPVPEDVGVKLRLTDLIANFRAFVAEARREYDRIEEKAATALLAHCLEVAQWRDGHVKTHERIQETFAYMHGLSKEEQARVETSLTGIRQADKADLREAMEIHQREHARQREADVLADGKMDTRLESMNGYSRTFREMQQLSVTRDQLDDKVNAVMTKVDTATSANGQGVTRVEAALNAQVQRLEAALVDLQTSRAQQVGRSTALSGMIGVATFVISLLVGVGLHFIK